jgi:hypothetical protein
MSNELITTIFMKIRMFRLHSCRRSEGQRCIEFARSGVSFFTLSSDGRSRCDVSHIRPLARGPRDFHGGTRPLDKPLRACGFKGRFLKGTGQWNDPSGPARIIGHTSGGLRMSANRVIEEPTSPGANRAIYATAFAMMHPEAQQLFA